MVIAYDFACKCKTKENNLSFGIMDNFSALVRLTQFKLVVKHPGGYNILSKKIFFYLTNWDFQFNIFQNKDGFNYLVTALHYVSPLFYCNNWSSTLWYSRHKNLWQFTIWIQQCSSAGEIWVLQIEIPFGRFLFNLYLV